MCIESWPFGLHLGVLAIILPRVEVRVRLRVEAELQGFFWGTGLRYTLNPKP